MYHKRGVCLLRICTVLMALIVFFGMVPLTTYAAAAGSKPAKIKTVKLSKSTTTTLTIKWSKSSGAKKYQVAYKKSGAKKYKTVTVKNTKRTYKISKLKANTNYYVKVRGVNGKKKGKWSSAKKLKTKVPSKDTTTGVDYSKAANETKVKVSVSESKVTITIASLGKSGTGILYRMPANSYMKGDSVTGLVNSTSKGTRLGSFKLNKKKTFTIDRYTSTGYDKLYDKYYIVKDGKIVKGPVYATAVVPERDVKVEMDVPTKKGIVDEMGGESFAVAEDLGCSWTAVNIDFTSLVLANEDAKGNPINNNKKSADTIEVNGKTYYMNKSYVSQLDSTLSRYKKMGINVVGICISFVSTESESQYPRSLKYIDDARWTNGFNTSNKLGRDYFIACMEYLANRYSKGNKGLICDYIIGNEIDYTYDWYEIIPNKSKTGEPLPPRGSEKYLRKGEIEERAPFDTFMEEYSRTLRLANLAVKKYSSDIRVGISLSKEWSLSRANREKVNRETNKRYDSYAPKEVLDWLNYFSKKNGDYNWTITPHNYPMANCNSAAFETGLSEESQGKVFISGDPDKTQMISINNLEVLQLYLDREHFLFNGKAREVFFTENGSSSGSETGTPPAKNQKEQAAEIAQYYYRAASLPSVKAIIYYKITDRDAEGSTSFKLGLKDTTGADKLSYNLWKYIDTDRSFKESKKYLGNISFKKNGKEYSVEKGNIKSYRDLMEIVDSSFNWNKYWDEKALTPVKVEEEEIADERSLEIDRTSYGADDPILVTASGWSSDVVGLYRKGDTPADGAIFSYEVGGPITSENEVRSPKHSSGSQYDIRAYGKVNSERIAEAALPAGDYTVILSDDEENVLMQKELTITGTSEFASGKKISASKSTYSVGEDIIITASGEGLDWAGIYRKGETPSGSVNSFYWYYVSDGNHVSGKPAIIQNGKANSRATILPAGEYEAVLLENDGYKVLARSETITVEESADGGSNSIDSVEYTLDDPADGFANGTVTITKDKKSGSSACLMYWADEEGIPLEGYTSLAKIRLDGSVTTHRMQPNTIIPPGARTLIAYGMVGNTKSEKAIVVKLPEGCNYKIEGNYDVSLAVMSDLHVVSDGSTNDFNENTNYHTTIALQDIADNLPDNIGVFVNGDMADHGRASEFKKLYNLYMGVEGAPDMHLVIGNHDWRTGNPDRQFQKYANMFNPAVEPEEVYYDEWVAGYHFIYMASESEGTVANISQEQLDWLEELLDKDTREDPTRPVFLFLHEGLMDSMAGNYPGQWGYTNSVFQDGEVKDILSRHGQVVMFGGHTHYELNTENSVTAGSEEIPVSVNTSAVGYLWDAYNTPAGEYLYGAQGLFLKVFDDKIYIFGRDFITGEYVPSCMYVVEPVKLEIKRSKISMNVGDKAVNLGATAESGYEITYTSLDPTIARADDNGNVKAVSPGEARIVVSVNSSATRAINRRTVYVTVTKAN